MDEYSEAEVEARFCWRGDGLPAVWSCGGDSGAFCHRVHGAGRGEGAVWSNPEALSKLLKCEGWAGAEGTILPYVGHLKLISTLKIGADCFQLRQYKLTNPTPEQ